MAFGTFDTSIVDLIIIRKKSGIPISILLEASSSSLSQDVAVQFRTIVSHIEISSITKHSQNFAPHLHS